MAKKPTIADVGSGYFSSTLVNSAFDAIRTAFDNTVSRDGSSPNQMESDFDLNNNDLLNVGTTRTNKLYIAGQPASTELISQDSPVRFFETKTDVEASNVPSAFDVIRTSGYSSIGDGGQALYIRSASEPSHPGKVQSSDGAWFELVVEDGKVNVRALGAADNEDSTQAFRDSFEVAMALKSDHDFTYSGTWGKGFPTIYIPAGTYIIDLSDGLSLWDPSSAKYGISVKGDGMFQSFIRLTAGTNETIFYNDNAVTNVLLADFSIYDETGNTGASSNLLYYMTSTGTAKRPILQNINTRGMRVASLDGTGNSDHLRAYNCMFERVPKGAIGIHVSNSQSVDHQLHSCEWPILWGTAIQVSAGGALSCYGGSVVIGRAGKFLHIEGDGSSIGSGNNAFDMYSVKFEMRDILPPDGAGTMPAMLYLNATAVVNFWGGSYLTDATSAVRTDQPFQIESKGRVNVFGATNWDDNYSFRLKPDNSGSTYGIPPEVAFYGCNLKAQLGTIVKMTDPPGGTTTYQGSLARAFAQGCFGGYSTQEPVDCSINAQVGQRPVSVDKKRAFFTRSANKNGTLPGTTAMECFIPQGAIITNIGVRHVGGTGPASQTYVFKDGNGTTRWTSPSIAQADNVTLESGTLSPTLVADATSRQWTCEGSTDVVAEGFIYIDYY